MFQEIEAVIQNGTFEVVDADDVMEENHMIKSSFIDSIKRYNTASDIRVDWLLITTAIANRHHLWRRHRQSNTYQNGRCYSLLHLLLHWVLTRGVLPSLYAFLLLVRMRCVHQITKWGTTYPGNAVKVVKPLYRILGSGLHWYLTCLDPHSNNFDMYQSHADHVCCINRTKNN